MLLVQVMLPAPGISSRLCQGGWRASQSVVGDAAGNTTGSPLDAQSKGETEAHTQVELPPESRVLREPEEDWGMAQGPGSFGWVSEDG